MTSSNLPVKGGDPMGATDATVSSSCGSALRGRPNERCGNGAGERTEHPGRGRCWLHGGLSPMKSGRYSMIKSERLLHIMQQLEDQGDPLDLTPDVTALRTLFVDYINRYDEYTEALLAWYDSFALRQMPSERIIMAMEKVVVEYEILLNENGEPTPNQNEDMEYARQFINYWRKGDIARPRTVMDIADAKQILAEVGKMVERIEKVRAQNAISRPELNRIYQEMWRAVDGCVDSEEVKKDIKKLWLNISL